MGTFDWAVDLAKQLIDANGESVTLKVFTTALPDTNFPNEQGDSTEQTLTARAVFLNYRAQDAGQTYKDGSEIHRDDKKVLMAAKGLTFNPNLQGNLQRADGSIYRIIKVVALDPDGPKIYFELQARR